MALSFNPQALPVGPITMGSQQMQLPQDAATQDPGFMARLAQAWHDPNVRQALTSTGLNLMKSPGYGQNGFDTASNALSMGVNTLQQLRERDRMRELEADDIGRKAEQQRFENTQKNRMTTTTETNANTNKRAVDANVGNLATDNTRQDKALDETIRHNKGMENVGMAQANAAQIRANKTGGGAGGKTSAEIEKINRMKAFYKQKNPQLTDEDADKMAMDYVSSSKGKTPRQQVLDAFQMKAKSWLEMQYDPQAQPSAEQVQQWKKEAMDEVKSADAAGSEISAQSGPIVRPNSPVASIPAEKSEQTDQKITIWKSRGGTPAQIKQLLINQGENPALYGY